MFFPGANSDSWSPFPHLLGDFLIKFFIYCVAYLKQLRDESSRIVQLKWSEIGNGDEEGEEQEQEEHLRVKHLIVSSSPSSSSSARCLSPLIWAPVEYFVLFAPERDKLVFYNFDRAMGHECNIGI